MSRPGEVNAPQIRPATGLHPAFSGAMQRELYFNTLDFLIKAIEAKEAEIGKAGAEINRQRLEAQMTHLQQRLHVEFCYLSAFADDGGEAV